MPSFSELIRTFATFAMQRLAWVLPVPVFLIIVALLFALSLFAGH
jgi:hypothetical protein